MGLSIKELVPSTEIEITDLKGKVIAIDTYNMLYQFITTIRSRDGSPLANNKGDVTSHLVGLFARTTNFMEKGLKPVFVFDGKAPKLKQEERERRKELKIEAEKKYHIAVQKQDIDEMKKFAARTSRLTSEMVDDAKELISALGLPIVDAPSEGEAQAAYMAKKDYAYASVSQDYDSLLYGCPHLVRNLSIAGKRKSSHHLGYVSSKPEIVMLSDVLNNLGIDNDQLIVLAILVGTDYNRGGIKGIGPKNALKLVKEHKKDFNSIFSMVKWEYPFAWTEVYDLIKNMPVTDDFELSWGFVDEAKLTSLLVDKYNFSSERVSNTINPLLKGNEKKQQRSLSDF